MDPQACLSRIADNLNTRADCGDAEECDAAIHDLGNWLAGGGFPPVACGEVFPRFRPTVPTLVIHSQDRQWSISSGDEGKTWEMFRYGKRGNMQARFAFRTE